MAGPKAKVPECLKSLINLGKTYKIISADEAKQKINMEVKYGNQAFQTAVRRIYFLVWAKPYVEQVKRKGGNAQKLQMNVSTKVSAAELHNTETKYVDPYVKERSPSVLGMLTNISNQSYEHPRRALMYVIEKCSEAANKGVCDYLTTLATEHKIDGIKVGNIQGDLSRLTGDITDITKELQKSSDQDSERVKALEEKQDKAAAKEAKRKELKKKDIEEGVDKTKRVKRRISRFFRSDGMTKKEREEAERQKTAQAAQENPEIKEPEQQQQEITAPEQQQQSISTGPKPEPTKGKGNKLEQRFKVEGNYTKFCLVKHENVGLKNRTKSEVKKFNWAGVKEILTKQNAEWYTPGMGDWKSLDNKLKKALDEGKDVQILVAGVKTKQDMIELRNQLRQHGCTIRGEFQ